MGYDFGLFAFLQSQADTREKNARCEANTRDAAARFEAEQNAAEQQALQLSLTSYVKESVEMAAGLPKLVKRANHALDVAEQNFSEGIFAPFWDAVERAVTDLAQFTSHTNAIVRHAQQHRAEVLKFNGIPPPFQIGVDTLPDASRVTDRMQLIVRRAQKNFQFATIYEQRKTNQLLVSGFNSLGHAISDLGERIETSLDQLSPVVSVGFTDLASAQRQATETLSGELQNIRDQATQESAARRDHEKQEREMLDNIQRRRKPLPPKLRDGQY